MNEGIRIIRDMLANQSPNVIQRARAYLAKYDEYRVIPEGFVCGTRLEAIRAYAKSYLDNPHWSIHQLHAALEQIVACIDGKRDWLSNVYVVDDNGGGPRQSKGYLNDS